MGLGGNSSTAKSSDVRVLEEQLFDFQTDGTYSPKDLTGRAVSVTMVNVETGTKLLDAAAATIVDAVNGLVRITLTPTQTATAGLYRWSWRVRPAGGGDGETYPTDGYNLLDIQQSLE